ncbi:MAG: rhodanese-like domain-containing protein [Candidatus Marinimicrobia bacterium]|nr:rhodanese-like domain-containing protein [Candidatus Neomarinimicrobiota bacterium]MEC7730289.1 rhodanese-like domain-containing protein [Candidatus Neomarinimicrobiota bacterium]
MDRNKQALFFLLAAVFLGAFYNFVLTDGIPLLAKPLEKVTAEQDLTASLLEPQVREIDLETARKLHEQNVLFVDARAEEYLQDGFIPGTVANDDVDALSQAIDELIGFDTGFVIYCSDDDCGSSEELAYTLQGYGFSNILVFQGGWKAWTEAELPIEYNE